MTHAEILASIHAVDPYAGFDAAKIPADLRGWYGSHPALVDFVRERDPSVLIEVGSWKGLSAVNFAKVMRHGSTVVCVDTWLGANEFWEDKADEERYGSLRLVYGYPSVYYTFLANVVRAGAQDKVVPLPLPSVQAARHLSRSGVRAGVVYVDASHEEEDVLADLNAYWPLVEHDGAMVGDDYDQSGVRAAVERFAADRFMLRFLDDAHHFWHLQVH